MDVLGYSGGRNEKEKSRGTGSELLAAEVPCVELVVPRASVGGRYRRMQTGRRRGRKEGGCRKGEQAVRLTEATVGP